MSYSGVQPTFGTFPSDLFTANGSNTIFTMSTVPGNDAALLVTIDGVRQHTDAYSYSANTLTFSEAPANGAVIETVNMGSRADVIITDGVYRKTQFTATAAQTNFDISTGYTVGFVDVYLNGIRLVVADDFTANDGSTIILASAAALGDSVEVVAYGTFNVANALQKSGDTMSGNLVISGTAGHVGAATFANTVAIAGTLTVNNIVTFDNTVQGTEGLVLARSGQSLNFNANYSASNTKATITTSAGMALALVTNGSNDKLYINANGHVTLPYQPALFAQPDSGTTVAVGASPCVYGWNTSGSIRFNRGFTVGPATGSQAKVFNASNTGRITVLAAGVYRFTFDQRCETYSGTGQAGVWVNGTQYIRRHIESWATTNYSHCIINGTLNLAANDYLEFGAWWNNSGTMGSAFSGTSDTVNWLSIEKVS